MLIVCFNITWSFPATKKISNIDIVTKHIKALLIRHDKRDTFSAGEGFSALRLSACFFLSVTTSIYPKSHFSHRCIFLEGVKPQKPKKGEQP